jgi:hypothetical protein
MCKYSSLIRQVKPSYCMHLPCQDLLVCLHSAGTSPLITNLHAPPSQPRRTRDEHHYYHRHHATIRAIAPELSKQTNPTYAHTARPRPTVSPTRNRRDYPSDQTTAPLTPPLRTGSKSTQSYVHGSHALASYSNCDERRGTGGSQATECALECRGSGGGGAATEQEDEGGCDAKRWRRKGEWCREENTRKR